MRPIIFSALLLIPSLSFADTLCLSKPGGALFVRATRCKKNEIKYDVAKLGLLGAIGPSGTTGGTGAQGNTGEKGATGASGTTGANGNSGLQGASGLDGATGVNGSTGATGMTGPTGSTGATGAVSGGSISGTLVLCNPVDSTGSKIYIPGKSFTVITGQAGLFSFLNVPAGSYSLYVRGPDHSIQGHTDSVLVQDGISTEANIYYNCLDQDGDEVFQPADCDDLNPSIAPGLQENCSDGIDNNCDGLVDTGGSCGSSE